MTEMTDGLGGADDGEIGLRCQRSSHCAKQSKQMGDLNTT